MQPILTLNRFKPKLALLGLFIVLIITSIFCYLQSSFEPLLTTFLFPFLFIFGFSTYFILEKLWVYPTHLEHKTIVRSKTIAFQDVSSVYLKKTVSTDEDGDKTVRFYLIFQNRQGEDMEKVPMGFFRDRENFERVLELIRAKNGELCVDPKLMDYYKKEGVGGKIFTFVLVGGLIAFARFFLYSI